MTDGRSFWDAVMLGFTASLMPWKDLPAGAVLIVLTSVIGAALVALVTERGTR